MEQILANSRSATFLETHINISELTDEIDFISIGQLNSVEFEGISYSTPEPSLYNTWPTLENRGAAYKFIGLWIELS